MAQKRNTASKSTKNTPSKGKKQASCAEKRAKKAARSPGEQLPIRYVLAPIFFGIAVFTAFAWFPGDSVVLLFVQKVLRGLGGKSGAVLTPLLFFALFMLQGFFWREYLIRRSVCASLACLHVSATAHMFATGGKWPVTFEGFLNLYTQGAEGTGGGFLGGLLCGLFRLMGKTFGTILLIFLGILCLLCVVDITVHSLLLAVRDRPRAPREQEKPHKDHAKAVVDHISNKHIEHVQRKKNIADYQMSFDDDPPAPKKPVSAKTVKAVNPTEPAETESGKIRERAVTPEEPGGPANSFDVLPITGETVIARQPEEVIEEPAVPNPVSRQMPPLEPVVRENRAAAPEHPKAAPRIEPVECAEPQPGTEKVTSREARISAAEVANEVASKTQAPKVEYMFPPLSLLKGGGPAGTDGSSELRENTRRLNEALQSFNIEAKICNVTRGPSVTRYEVELAQGVRLAKVTTLQNDLALALGTPSVRISAIPDKIAMVGIEVPNKQVTTVALRDVIGSSRFICAKSKTSFAVGKDIGGECITGDIAKLPHLLIAGTTGSGKSVCMNSLIVSILYKATPDDVKLIMVDPKMVELGVYNGIPHLLIPVVTDPKKAAGSLQWAVSEMMRRYKLMYDVSVRDLEALNRIVESTGEGEKLPQIVVIIDELADLMMVAAKEVEDSIVRIAQMGRASGIHLVIATQRPSSKVITGIMKANIPSRIAFAVASAMESRIILDTQGAEKLVGRGDMLYAPLGQGKPQRIQGCFVSDSEVEAVATYVKERSSAVYSQELMDELERNGEEKAGKNSEPKMEESEDEMVGDEMLPAAVDVFLETGLASVSMLQRRLKLGYARAARIVDEMEEKGIVGPFAGSKPRAILITKEQWQAMKGTGNYGEADPMQMSFDDEVLPDLLD